ncbi:MAG: hypothetical protein AAGU27_07920 [Dehalobacterium sp.]
MFHKTGGFKQKKCGKRSPNYQILLMMTHRFFEEEDSFSLDGGSSA